MPCCGLSRERFLRISLKFDSIGYMPYLRQILTSKPQKSSRDTLPYRFVLKFEVKFGNLVSNLTHRDPHPKNANLKICGAAALTHLLNFNFTTFATIALSSLRPLRSLRDGDKSPLRRTCSRVKEDFCIATLTTASRRGRVCFWQLSKRVRLNSNKRSAAKHKVSA